MVFLTRVMVALALVLASTSADAQMTTGSIGGRITDIQGGALPGVLVEARNVETGFLRSHVTDSSGVYHLAALPAGSYDLVAELAGFRRVEARNVVVNVSRDHVLDLTLPLAGVAQDVTVTAAAPLLSTTTASVGEVVDLARIQGLPLNGRQFANLAATVPGVTLGLHSDVTKSSQYTPQVSGGNGRNINYIVDGGDNNDDTVGGLLQLFPLESIQEFEVVTHRFDAEYGRSNGAVLNVLTKSGTNDVRATWFTLIRNEALNALTETERLRDLPKQAYQRYQLGGSLGGPFVRDELHYFAAFERTHQDTRQSVDTFGLFPQDEGIFDVPFRQNLFTAKVTATPRPNHHLALRYASDRNSQPNGATPTAAFSSWAISSNSFDSFNLNHNWVIGRSMLNELVFQYSDFVNDTSGSTPGPVYRFARTVTAGGSMAAPQETEQTKWQIRNDLSRVITGKAGLSHEFKGGINWVHEPELRTFAGAFTNGFYEVSSLSLTSPVVSVLLIGGDVTSNIPLDLFGLYVQDTWRATNRLTLNLGVRWDYVPALPIDQNGVANFDAMQAAGRAGRFAGTLLEDFGSEPSSDKDNVQPRLGAVFDVFGDGRNIIRGGWGVYTDLGYTNSNVLTTSFDRAGGGIIFNASDPAGLRKRDGSLFTINDPIGEIDHLNAVGGGPPPAGEVVSPLLEMPYTRQANVGWSHEIVPATVASIDYVRVDGRDLNMRVRPNVMVNGQRYLAGVGVRPNSATFRTALSKGSSRYDGLILALRRRMSTRLDLTASYTLAKATSDVGTAYDELNQNLIQDITDPFGPVQQAPSARTDSRHNVSLSAIARAPFAVDVAAIFYYRSALPIHTITGRDENADGNANDRTALAYRYTGAEDAAFESVGPCETVNCSRGAAFSQLNLRVSRPFSVGGVRIEPIAELFNVFNAKNPNLGLTQTQTNTSFMIPTVYAGDVNQPEQRVGQVGFRVSF